MGPHARVLLVASLASGFLALPALAQGQDCDAAQARLRSAWGTEFTRAVAEAARAVVDACPRAPAPPKSGTPLDARLAFAQATVSAHCGFSAPTSGRAGDAPITGWVQSPPLGVSHTEADHGPALATYHPDTNLTHYHAAGTNWTLDITNGQGGYVIAHGVLFPVDARAGGVSQAGAGCGPVPGPTVCWAYGYAQVSVGGVGSISAGSEFYAC